MKTYIITYTDNWTYAKVEQLINADNLAQAITKAMILLNGIAVTPCSFNIRTAA